ncbi:uncharacterized protein DFL_005871 [Arthrobotrys flagrans]|uniref:Cytochrome b561 domain-containing protein n=1 Tax=Arthrobotrys flagrans TaxID=97331 RepID=A0A436ZZE3_ARTFL|nr:hypothetical protein DFL_005871 [Arthrobotrys flagrans]
MRFTILHQLVLLFAYQALASSAPPEAESSLQQRTAPEFGSPASLHNVLPESISKRQNVDGPDSAAGEPGHGGRRTIKTTPTQRRTFRIAHGTIMGVAFTIGFPSGAIFIRVLQPPNHVYIHAATQIFSTAMAFTGMGLGIWLGLNVRYLDYLHTIIGFAVMACLVIQPIIGLIHHIRYKKVQRSTWWGFVHRWYGRVIVVLGIVNGGLGLLLAENTRAGEIAYAAVAGLAGFTYLMVVVQWLLRTRAVEKSMKKQKKDYMEPAGESREAVGLMHVS